MDRWRKLSLALLAVLVVATAGCSSIPPGSDSPGATSSPAATETRTGTPSDTRTEPPSPPGGTEVPAETAPRTVPADERLVLVKAIEENVTVSLYGDAGTPIPTNASAAAVRGEAEASVTYGPDQRGEIPVTAFDVDGYVVVSLDDEVIWQERVEPYEHVELHVDRDGEADVSEYFVL